MINKGLSGWVAVVGNTALVVSLILVAFQVEQNSRLVREQLFQQRWSDLFNRHIALMGENPGGAMETAIFDPEQLSYEEHIQIDGYLWHWLNYVLRLQQLGSKGMTDPDEWRTLVDPEYERYIPMMEYVWSNPYAKAWWLERRRHLRDTKLTDAMDRLVTSLPDNIAKERFEYIKQRMNDIRKGAPNELL